MPQKNPQKIYLIHADKTSVRQFFNTINHEEIDYWVYLGKKIAHFIEIEKIISGKIKRYEIGDRLEKNARQYRQEYIDFIGKCALDSDSPYWYLTSVSEKNPFVSNLYLNFCYMKTLFDIVNTPKGNICVFCESRSLIEALKSNLLNNTDLKIQYYDIGTSIVFESFLSKIETVKNKSWFIIRFFIRILIARLIAALRKSDQKFNREQPVIVIHSWADKRSFSDPDFYHDIYCGELGNKIERTSQKYFYLVNVLPTIFYPFAVKKLYSMRSYWHLFEEFLQFSDIFRALSVGSGYQKKRPENSVLSGLEISAIINEEYEHDRMGSRAEQAYLFYSMAKKIYHYYIIRGFIYPFENHIWEKMLINGIRETSDTTKIIGYAHATVNSMELSYSISLNEKKMLPLPDIIFVNGPRAKRVLVESGFDADRILISGSIRFGHLIRTEKIQHRDGKKRILVVLSGDWDKSIEMISKCIKAFNGLRDILILFKPHPTLKPNRFKPFISEISLMFLFTFEPISSLFRSADLVIYNDSTAAVEAAVLGIPLLHIKSDFTLDINVFEHTGIIPSAGSPEQIRSCTLEIIANPNNPSPELKNFVDEIFAPVDDATIMAYFSNLEEL